MKKVFEKKIFLACDLFGAFFGSLHKGLRGLLRFRKGKIEQLVIYFRRQLRLVRLEVLA